jgi:energy-coupling factor transport system permease protein
MLTNITIGQYYPVKSTIHALDSRVKLLGVIVFITALFLVTGALGYVLAGLALALVVYASNVPLAYLLKGLRGILFIIVFTVVINAFFTAGETVLFQFYFITVSKEGLINAGMMALRLIMLIISSSVLTLTTSPIELTAAIEFALKPLKKIGVPAHEIAMMMTIALRFIPTLLEELDKIMKAQMARGADFDTGGRIKKAKSLIPLLVPIFLSSFRRAEELAVAMEARCYRGDENRTRMKVMRLTPRDRSAFVCVAGFLALMLAARFFS